MKAEISSTIGPLNLNSVSTHTIVPYLSEMTTFLWLSRALVPVRGPRHLQDDNKKSGHELPQPPHTFAMLLQRIHSSEADAVWHAMTCCVE